MLRFKTEIQPPGVPQRLQKQPRYDEQDDGQRHLAGDQEIARRGPLAPWP
jgi:hypothetical protein